MEMHAKLSGQYHLIMRNVHTGEIKADVTVHNLITNNGLKMATVGAERRPINEIVVGSGTGTPAITDTALFHQLWYKTEQSNAVNIVSVDTIKLTRTFIFEASPTYVGSITEVGLRINYTGTLFSHAMISDAEGHTMAIEKTEDDELTIITEITCSLSNELLNYHSVLNRYMDASENKSLCNLLCLTVKDGGLVVGSYDSKTLYGIEFLGGGFMPYGLFADSKAFIDRSWVDATRSVRFHDSLRLTAKSKPGYFKYAKLIPYASRSSGRDRSAHGYLFDLTEAGGAWPGKDISNIRVGVGDGSTQDFKIPINYFKENTDTIYVNGTALTRNVDYIIDNASNSDALSTLSIVDMESTYQGTESMAGNPLFANFEYMTGSTTASLDKTRFAYQFTSNAPLNITLPEARFADFFRMHLRFYYTTGIRLFYSTDGEEYTQASEFLFDTPVTGWAARTITMPFTGVIAKYWRITLIPYGSGVATIQRDSTANEPVQPFLGHSVPYGLHFNTPPAADAIITMDCHLDIPYLSENFALSATFDCDLVFDQ